jgi:AraC-like DNA-binding protein
MDPMHAMHIHPNTTADVCRMRPSLGSPDGICKYQPRVREALTARDRTLTVSPRAPSRERTTRMYLSIHIVRATAEELLRQGVPLEVFCTRAGLEGPELADGAVRLPIERATQVIGAAVELSHTPALGLRVGESAPLKALHVVGHLLSSCADMREAVMVFLRYSSLVFEGGGFRLDEAGDEGRFAYEHPYPGSRFERFGAEVALAVALRLGVQITGPDKRPREVCFRHADPGYAAEYQRLFGCPVRFSQPVNELVFDRAVLDLPQVHRDELLCELLREGADRLLAQTAATEHLAERILEALKLQLELGAADPQRLARRFGMTLRSLQRRLQESRLSLTQLLDDARREVACAELRMPSVAIKEVAHRLGFSEPSAFYRAFKRWTGMTPAQFRTAPPRR